MENKAGEERIWVVPGNPSGEKRREDCEKTCR